MPTMKLINVIDEDFINYKTPVMSLLFPYCSMKCNKEAGREVCHNTHLNDPIIEVDIEKLCLRYIQNPISRGIVCYGKEPFDSRIDLFNFIHVFRNKYQLNDPIIIYTGYTEEEIQKETQILKRFGNIIIKFGRYIPDMPSHFDRVLGVELASPNQYGKVINENYEKS